MRGSGSGSKGSFLLLLCCALHSRTDSETSYTWRLDLAGEGKVVADLGKQARGEEVARQEVVMDILLSTVTNHDGMWKKTTNENHCSLYGISHCQETYGGHQARNNRGLLIETPDIDDEVLDCGKAVNFTYYDHLVGIQNRASHLHIPEPEVANLFKKKSKKGSEIDIDSIERRLKKSKREKPKSVEIYNQIANFWRIKGDTQASIECFRRALAVSPNNAEILLNLARVLFNLQYLDDAIFLTRRSLEVQPPDQNAWQQHFQARQNTE
jgi:tetratricopeptide (TPR) repeat protein